MNYYRLVGGVHIRQMRMSNESCTERRFQNYCTKEVVSVTTGNVTTNATKCIPR